VTDVHVLGVRHHGPGSARSVAAVLDLVRPDVVVIEGAPELDELVTLAASPDLVPPVAALVYRADQPGRASFWPFASFSPEWVALRWALAHGATVRFADLPAANALLLEEQAPGGDEPGTAEPGSSAEEDSGEEDSGDHEAGANGGPAGVRDDPIAVLARTAGYEDPERWWEDAVEHRTGALEGFAAIREAMTAIRQHEDTALGTAHPGRRSEARHNARREAAMRRVLRAVIKSGAPRIAVVCGAYHAPVMHPDDFPTLAADTALLKGLRRTKVTATWAPWTARRLGYASGYGAGVTSPGWYAHCFATPTEEVVSRWMVIVAQALRGHDLDAPSASAIDAVRLAQTLAALRGRPQAGLAECTEAVQTVLCGGSAVPLQLIHDEVVVGHALGQVPEETPQVPLARDLDAQAKTARLRRAAQPKLISLDLRTDAGLRKSVLLHRLDLLDVRWGRATDVGGSAGTFKEAWTLEWRPELAVAVIEAGVWGTTVASAAEARAADLAAQAPALAGLTDVLERCLPADLPTATAAVVDQIERRSAGQHDTMALMRSAEPLARSCRYGDVRQMDTTGLRQVLRALVQRVAASLGPAVAALDDDAAQQARVALDGVQRAVSLLGDDDPTLLHGWLDALSGVAAMRGVHGAISGRVVRLLLDNRRVHAGDARDRLSRELSPAREARQAAAYLDGFLDGDATLLLLDHELLALIDDWMERAADAAFDDLLPLLRRTFSRYSAPERRAIGPQLRRGGGSHRPRQPEADIDAARAEPAVRKVLALLHGRSA
ncbi:MAG TPA: DUF5682 family protein, partial [Euzebya sp.]|nr:DUF5682 family protein [Euzebya sp.]